MVADVGTGHSCILAVNLLGVNLPNIAEVIFRNREPLIDRGSKIYTFEDKLGSRNIDTYAYAFHKNWGFDAARGVAVRDEDSAAPQERTLARTTLLRAVRSIRRAETSESSLLLAELHDAAQLERFQIAKIKAFLEEGFPNIRVVLNLLRQDLLASCAYDKALKSGTAEGFTDWAKGVLQKKYLKYDQLLETWTSVFDKDQIFINAIETGEGISTSTKTALKSIFALEDQKLAAITSPPRAVTMQPLAQKFLLYVNTAAQNADDAADGVSLDSLHSYLERNYSEPAKSYLTRDNYRMLDRFTESNDRFRRSWAAERPRLFKCRKDDLPKDPEAAQDPLAVAQIFAKFMEDIGTRIVEGERQAHRAKDSHQ